MERIPSAEKIRGEIFAKFCHTTERGYQQFRERVQKNNGHIRIAVHPFFAERFPATTKSLITSEKLPEALKFIRNGFTRTVQNVIEREDSSPLIVFEEDRGMTQTADFLATVADSDDDTSIEDILCIETYAGTGLLNHETIAPLFDKLHPSNDISYRDALEQFTQLLTAKKTSAKTRLDTLYESAWSRPLMPEEKDTYRKLLLERIELEQPFEKMNELINAYRQQFINEFIEHCQIKSIHAQGAYITGDEKQVDMCLGMIIQMFRDKGIPVDISKYVLPGRDELRSNGVVTKQTGSKTAEM